jgi:hypothetical protein
MNGRKILSGIRVLVQTNLPTRFNGLTRFNALKTSVLRHPSHDHNPKPIPLLC